jgi:hypothetical protein
MSDVARRQVSVHRNCITWGERVSVLADISKLERLCEAAPSPATCLKSDDECLEGMVTAIGGEVKAMPAATRASCGRGAVAGSGFEPLTSRL